MLGGGIAEINVLQYDIETAYTKFELAPGFRDELTTILKTPLVFELQVDRTDDLQTSSITVNRQLLNITWTQPHQSASAAIVQPTTQKLIVPTRSGVSHSLAVSFTGETTQVPGVDGLSQSLNIHVDSVDGSQTGLSFIVLAQPTAAHRLLGITPAVSSKTFHFDHFEKSFMIENKELSFVDDKSAVYKEDEYDIASEIESLLLLETEATELQAAITGKKEAIANCLKDHRNHVPLRHLLSQCDDLVCTAKVIAQRICDKMGILTVPNTGYAKVQDPDVENLIDLHDEKFPSNASVSEHSTQSKNIHSAAAIQSVRLVYPQNVLFKVLGVIATALGLTALFAYIRRKCMSARRRVERAADAEERRNARAYRRAARRAEMRRRWDALMAAINCFGSQPEPATQNYEEKRALILQDAFLEQEADAVEKGEIMEAEIRELRHAHEIVASLVRVDENRYDLVTPLHDPPPPMVPLPYTPAARSRASTATLPSYTSETLPDYTSRYTRTEAGSTGRSGSSLRSASIGEDGLGAYTSTRTSEQDNSSSHRSHSPGSNNSSARRSRYTPTSSVVETSPRPSGETLRTNYRFSRDSTGTSS